MIFKFFFINLLFRSLARDQGSFPLSLGHNDVFLYLLLEEFVLHFLLWELVLFPH